MKVIPWDTFISEPAPPLAVTIGVFDGVHRGHQALLRLICGSPWIPAVVTFRQNPLRILRPQDFQGDIFSLEQKLHVFEQHGVQLTVLIDFSERFSIISGGDFIKLLAGSGQVKMLALGRNFRCGAGQDTGVDEIAGMYASCGVEICAVGPVMEGARRVSSSRIRRAIGEGNLAEAALLLGRNVAVDLAGLPVTESGGMRRFDAAALSRVIPPAGVYPIVRYAADSAEGIETEIAVQDGAILVPAAGQSNPATIEFALRPPGKQ